MLPRRLQMVTAPQRACRWGGVGGPSLTEGLLEAWLCSGCGKSNVSGQSTSQGQKDNEIDVHLSYFIRSDCKVLSTWHGS